MSKKKWKKPKMAEELFEILETFTGKELVGKKYQHDMVHDTTYNIAYTLYNTHDAHSDKIKIHYSGVNQLLYIDHAFTPRRQITTTCNCIPNPEHVYLIM